jgi:hypothetical protein
MSEPKDTGQNMSEEAVQLFIERLAEIIVRENLIPDQQEGEGDAPTEKKD